MKHRVFLSLLALIVFIGCLLTTPGGHAGPPAASVVDTARFEFYMPWDDQADSIVFYFEFTRDDPGVNDTLVVSGDTLWPQVGQTFSAKCDSFTAWITGSYGKELLADSFVFKSNQRCRYALQAWQDSTHRVDMDSLKSVCDKWPWQGVWVHIIAPQCGFTDSILTVKYAGDTSYVYYPMKRIVRVNTGAITLK